MSKKTLFWLAVVLIIAGFLRFCHLSTTPPGLYPDEAMDGNNALQALHTGVFKVFYTPNNGEEGLFANVEAGLLATSGIREPWTLRFPSAVFGFLTVLGVFFLTRELFKENQRRDAIALLSAFLIATSFWHINFSRIGFRAIMAPFFLVWALYFFLKAIRRPLPTTHYSLLTIFYSLLAGLSFGLGFYSYISYRITPLLFILAIPFFRKEKNFSRVAGIFVATTFIVALPLGLYFLHNPADFLGRTSQVSIFSSTNPALEVAWNSVKTIGMLDVRGDGNWRHNVAGRPELFWPVGIMFWIGVIVAIGALFRKNLVNTFAPLLCFAWVALAALPVVFSDEGIPHALRAILMIPPIMIFAGAGGVWLYDWILKKFPLRRQLLNASTLIILALLAFESAHTYFVVWAGNPNVAGAFNANYAALGQELRSLPQSMPKYVVVNAGGGTTAQVDPWAPYPVSQNNIPLQYIPIPAQTVMYLTDTYGPAQQKADNLHYVLPANASSIPPGAATFYIN